MPTIQQQLNQLKKDKATLNTMLNTMGVETTGNETFTQLAPLVGKIVTDPILQDKAVEITENGTTTITADKGYNGLNNVEIKTNVSTSNEESKLNIFIQEEEPQTKDGIWLKNKELEYNDVELLNYESNFNINWDLISGDIYPDYCREVAMATDGENLYVGGGNNYNNRALSYFGYIDLETYTYHQLPSLPYQAYGIVFEYYEGCIYMFGGRNGSTVYNYTYKYDIETQTFTKLTNIPYGVGQAGSTIIGSDVYLVGGTIQGDQTTNVYKYNILTNSYTKLANLPDKRNTPAVCNIGTDVYIFGGFHGTRTALDEAYKYDVLTDKYTKLANMPYSAYSLGANAFKDKIFVFGGINGTGSQSFDLCYEYDIATNTYTQKSNMYLPLGRLTNTVIANNNIYAICGQTLPNSSGHGNQAALFIGKIEDVNLTYENDKNSIIINVGNQNINKIKLNNSINVNVKKVIYYSIENGLDETMTTYYGDGKQWNKI